MKLVCPKNKHLVKYLHVYKTIEGISYNYKNYPQNTPPELTSWQLKYLVEAATKDAKKANLELRH